MLSTVAGLYRVPGRAVRHHDRLHQQSLLGLDARLRQSRIDVRRREPDGRARRAARPRPPRDPPPQRDPAGRRQPAGLRHHLVRDGASAWTRSTRGDAARACRRRRPAGGAASATPACSTSAAARASTAPTAAAPSSSSTTSARVSLITGASEIGQGSETVLAMIVAETLGVPLGARGRRQLRHRGEAAGTSASTPAARRSSPATPPAWPPRSCAASCWPWPPRSWTSPGRALARRAAGGSASATAARSAAWRTIARSRAGHLREARPDAGGRGVLRSADRDARQGPARQRLGRRTASPRRPRCWTWSEATGAIRVSAGRLRPRRRAGAQSAGRRGADPRAASTWGSAMR